MGSGGSDFTAGDAGPAPRRTLGKTTACDLFWRWPRLGSLITEHTGAQFRGSPYGPLVNLACFLASKNHQSVKMSKPLWLRAWIESPCSWSGPAVARGPRFVFTARWRCIQNGGLYMKCV